MLHYTSSTSSWHGIAHWSTPIRSNPTYHCVSVSVPYTNKNIIIKFISCFFCFSSSLTYIIWMDVVLYYCTEHSRSRYSELQTAATVQLQYYTFLYLFTLMWVSIFSSLLLFSSNASLPNPSPCSFDISKIFYMPMENSQTADIATSNYHSYHTNASNGSATRHWHCHSHWYKCWWNDDMIDMTMCGLWLYFQ